MPESPFFCNSAESWQDPQSAAPGTPMCALRREPAAPGAGPLGPGAWPSPAKMGFPCLLLFLLCSFAARPPADSEVQLPREVKARSPHPPGEGYKHFRSPVSSPARGLTVIISQARPITTATPHLTTRLFNDRSDLRPVLQRGEAPFSVCLVPAVG